MITSRNNPKITRAHALRQKKHRDSQGLFLIDGTKLLKEALENNIEIVTIFATADWLGKNTAPLEGEIVKVNGPVLEKLSGVKSSEGVVAVAKKPLKNLENSSAYLFLEDIQDPGNLGTIIRTADAFGYKNIILSKACADIYNEKTLRATMGSLFHVNVIRKENFYEELESFKSKGYSLIGTSLEGELLNKNTFKVPEQFILLLGNEANGLSQKALGLCSSLVKIPIIGQAESLNVSVAAGIFLFLYSLWC